MKEKIIPKREKCPCGKKVTSHHWLCDKCYGKKARIEDRIKKEQFTKKNTKSSYVKKILEEKIKKLQKELKDSFSENNNGGENKK